MLKYSLSLLLTFLVLGCHAPSAKHADNTASLSTMLLNLSPNIPHDEAERLAAEIYRKTDALRVNYDPVSEPHLNNFLINVGVKKEGLCYQWSDALYLHFKKRDYPHFSFHLLVSGKGKYFSEHNVMVVAAKGGKVMDGEIIDPWREPGKIYFSKVKEDNAYTWKWRKEREIMN